MRISKKAVFYSAMILSFSNITMQAIAFIYRIFLSRMLGAEGMGVYQLIFPVSAIIQSVALSGLSMAVTKISAERNALGDKPGMNRLVRMALSMFVSLFLTAALPTVLFSKWISAHLLGDERTRLAVLIFIPCMFLTGFENIFKSWFYGIKDVKYPVISDILEQLIRISCVVSLLLIFKPKDPALSVALVVTGMLSSEIFSSVFMGNLFVSRQNFRAEKKQSGEHLFGQIISIAVPVSFTAVVSNLLNSANIVLLPQRLILSGLSKAQALSATGILSGMVVPFFMLPVAFIGPVATVMLPKVSEGMALKNNSDIQRKTGKAFHVTSLFAMPALSALMVLGKPLCALIYKQNIPSSYIFLVAAASLFVYYQIIAGSILNGLGMQKKAMFIVILGGIIQLAFTWFAVADSRIGIYGYLWGDIVSSAVVTLIGMLFIENKTNVEMKWLDWFVMPALSALLTGFAAKAVYMRCLSDNINDAAAVILALLCGVLVYIALIRLQGISIMKYIKTLVPKGQNANPT